jgi:hypothetical protein
MTDASLISSQLKDKCFVTTDLDYYKKDDNETDLQRWTGDRLAGGKSRARILTNSDIKSVELNVKRYTSNQISKQVCDYPEANCMQLCFIM